MVAEPPVVVVLVGAGHPAPVVVARSAGEAFDAGAFVACPDRRLGGRGGGRAGTGSGGRARRARSNCGICAAGARFVSEVERPGVAEERRPGIGRAPRRMRDAGSGSHGQHDPRAAVAARGGCPGRFGTLGYNRRFRARIGLPVSLQVRAACLRTGPVRLRRHAIDVADCGSRGGRGRVRRVHLLAGRRAARACAARADHDPRLLLLVALFAVLRPMLLSRSRCRSRTSSAS